MTRKQLEASMPTPVGLMIILVPFAVGLAGIDWVRNLGKK